MTIINFPIGRTTNTPRTIRQNINGRDFEIYQTSTGAWTHRSGELIDGRMAWDRPGFRKGEEFASAAEAQQDAVLSVGKLDERAAV